MADFESIPINGTAEQLEKLLNMDIVESISEDSTKDEIPTAGAVFDFLNGKGAGGSVSYLPQELDDEQKTQARENIGACKVDDSAVGGDAWSSKNIVDKLCPSFTESGSVVTCEPIEGYPLEVTAEDGATEITQTGKNVFGGNALVDTLKSKDLGGGVLVNEADKTVNFLPGKMDRTKHLFYGFKENTQYTIIFYGYNTDTAGVTNLRLVYTDESSDTIYFGSFTKPIPANEPGYIYWKTKAGKTADYIRLSYANGSTVLYYDQCGVFEGDVSLEEFEAYMGKSFELGEPIPALSGVNTLWADTGDITVQGKSDPVAIINKLTNAIIATGGNV